MSVRRSCARFSTLLAAALVAATVLVPATAASATPGSTVRVNLSTTGQPSADGEYPSISADGSVVIFTSGSGDLIPGVEGTAHLYARNRVTSTTELVDVTTDGTPSDAGNISDADISASGRYVVFTSASSVFDPSGGENCTQEIEDRHGVTRVVPAPCQEVYVRDLVADTTEKVSIAMSGGINGDAFHPSISGDGRTVAFVSEATNIVPGDTNGTTDVFVRDLDGGTTELVSVASDGGSADDRSTEPDISADGSTVVFASSASNLGGVDVSLDQDIFVRDLQAGTTEPLIPMIARSSSEASVSGDGSVVAFSTQSPLLPGDALNTWDVYVYDRSNDALTSPSINAAGQYSGRGQMSENGRFVLFRSGAALAPGTTDGVGHVYVRDLLTGTTTLEGVRSDGAQPNNGVDSGAASISGDGRFVVFWTSADDVVPNDVPYTSDAFVHDRATPAESASGSGLATTDGEGDGATLADPIETEVGGSPGSVSIEELAPGAVQPPSGSYTVLGQQVRITAADALPGEFLTFTFVVDVSALPDNVPLAYFTLLRNGAPLADCSGAGDIGPCVASRSVLADGDLKLVAHSPAASVWAVVAPSDVPVDQAAPSIDLRTPANGGTYAKGSTVTIDYSCADTGGSGLASCTGDRASGTTLDTSTVGTKTFTVQATDGAGNSTSVTATYRVVFAVSGFFAPIDNAPVVNKATAGRAIPAIFSLGGDQGLGVFEAGYPVSRAVTCQTGAPIDAIEQTVTAGQSSLSYSAGTGRYTYTWKTDKSWGSAPAGPCRELILRFVDGSQLHALFTFK